MTLLEQLKEWAGKDGLTVEQAEAKMIDYLTTKGMTVRTTDQDKTYLESNSQRMIDEAFQKRNQQLEDTIRAKTGVEKANPSEKYYDYFARAVDVVMGKIADATAKIKEFQDKGGSAVVDDYKQQVAKLQKDLKDLKDTHQQEISTERSKVFTSRFTNDLSTAVDKIRAKLDIDPKIQEDVIAARLAKFREQYDASELEGVTIFKEKKSNEPVLSKQDGKHKNLQQMVEEAFADLMKAPDPGHQGAGAGSGSGAAGAGNPGGQGSGAGAGGQGAPGWKGMNRPAAVTSKMKVLDFLSKDLKLNEGTKEHAEAFAHFSKGTDGKELPLKD